MGAVIGLLFGLGVLLVWHSRAPVRPERPDSLAKWKARRTAALRQAGITGVGPWQVMCLQLAAGLLAGMATLALSRSISVATCFVFFGFFSPVGMIGSLRRRRRLDFREVWPEVVDSLASAVRAGLSLPEGVAALAVRGPAPLQAAFGRFASDYRITGKFSDCLDRLKTHLADPVGDRICESLRLAREVGGTDLGRLLRTLSTFLRDESRTRAELETRQNWTINAARLAVAAPWLVLLLLATQSATLSAYESFAGRILLLLGAVVSILAYRAMVRIGRLPEEKRVLQ